MRLFLWRIAVISLLIICSAAQADGADAAAEFPAGFKVFMADEPVFGGRVKIVEGGDADRPSLLLIHGLGQNAARDWLTLLPELAEHYHVLTFDLPGFGGSDLPDAAYTPERYAELAHWLVQRYARGKAHVVGHSLGAAIALFYTYRFPDDVERLLVIDAAGLLQSAVFARHLATVQEPAADRQPAQAVIRSAVRAANKLSHGFIDWMEKWPDPSKTLLHNDFARGLLIRDQSLVNAALGLATQDFTPVLRKVETPVWILWGELDPVAPVRSAYALHALLPRSQIKILPGVKHVPMQEAAPQTMDWILSALMQPTLPPTQKSVLTPGYRDADCRRQRGMRFTGSWRTLRLDGCKDVLIENARLQSLVVRNSTVILNRTQIDSGDQGTAIEAERSTITATDLRIRARQIMTGKRARFDIAAADIQAQRWGKNSEDLRIAFSLSYWCDGVRLWRLHDVWLLGDTDLEKEMRKQSDGECGSDARPSIEP